MPAISKIRFTNVVYEDGNKRYNDELFHFDGHNGAILLENGGGKTVFIQTALQAVLPHADLAGRKMKDTLSLASGAAHVAIEWILNDRPRRYVVTCVSLFMTATGLDSYRYVYDYPALDTDAIERIPFVKGEPGRQRAADKGEIYDYYQGMAGKRMNARLLPTIKEYKAVLEQDYHIIASEWERIAKVNSTEGGVESFFDECKTTSQLFDRLLIPTVEDALLGYSQGEFADTFETHRESFKKYKELKERIAENQGILLELDRYVQAVAKWDGKQRAYADEQALAKAYWALAGEQRDEEQARLGGLRQQLAASELRERELGRRRDSLHIARQKQEQDALETKLALAEEDVERLETAVRGTKRGYYSLRLADYKRQWREAGERIDYVERQLAQLGGTEEEAALQAAWRDNGGQIRSLFRQQERQWQDEERQLQEQLGALEMRRGLEKTVLGELAGELERLNNRVIEYRSTMAARERDREQLRRSVLANPAAESMESSLSEWSERERKLDESNMQLLHKLKELGAERERHAAEQEQAEAALKTAYAQRSQAEMGVLAWKGEHQALLAELAAYRPTSWSRLTSVYDKMSSITDYFEDELSKQRADKEALLQKERLAFRYIDDYSGQHEFFADVYTAGLLDRWRSQFTLLQTGLQYLRSVGLTQQAELYPFWAVTVIVTEPEVGRLADKLRQYAEDLQFPVQIVSVQEAERIARQGEREEAADRIWIEPQIWRGNADGAGFAEWKAAVSAKGEESRAARQAKERELERLAEAQGKLTRFLTLYPLETAQELERQLSTRQGEVRELENRCEELKRELRQGEQTMALLNATVQEQKEERAQLQLWMEKARTYMELGREVARLKASAEELGEQAEAQQAKLALRQRVLEQVEGEIEAAKARGTFVRVELATLRGQELYAELADAVELPAERSLEWLKTERKDLHLKLHRISQGRQQLESERQHAASSKAALEKEMSQLRQEQADLALDEALSYTASGEAQMAELLGELQELQERLGRAKTACAAAEKLAGAQAARVKLLVEQYGQTHGGERPLVFLEALHAVEEKLQDEEREAREQTAGLQTMLAQAQGQLARIEEALQELSPYKLLHGFENPLLAAARLTPEAHSDFRYDRMKIVKQALAKLTAARERAEAEETVVRKAKAVFVDFCRKHVKDVKLREMAEQGIEQKNGYAEVAAFQTTMNSRIERVNHVAEETMRSHNQQLEQYLIHVHSHLKLIASELKDIPNKTKVKVEEQWKAIYSFHIPDWEEAEAKERLRKHLEWILAELEKGHYRDDSGLEIKSTVRKELEKWLDTKQLLQIVLQDKPMRVACRKVTNENNVTKASFSWEQSNNWSGGEKWSKNMTLFLGLLNYVAEKRQHIQANMKRHRTVILDNPFGKASSDHVLSPVFFIAEQLGFQIIALTAHAEGKFLKDYFPVVFSCRLRPAASSGKLVMSKEKEINQAYFRDHAPQSLQRLEDVKQIELLF
ncbi:chromosome segregation ATPase [Paenibacillus athensensis]|uniref:Chromosome segregation ATPase n=1 Tax=Paenibacillus athensensis TaxID=1967502 RepID=A0A4Y8Q6E7_9BACL|nr:chromosome segregation ATPase [Paenibacillus athensensis]MCD1259756.1 chromosome segregation ATPase [Paenibacillus athensensis]